ncbi:MAG: FecCD family ABC transporter permease [Halomonas sp.]
MSRLTLRLRRPVALSWRLERRVLILALLALGALLAGTVAALSLGSYPLPLHEVLHSLLAQAPSPLADLIVNELRAPRVMAALLVGAALGVSGAIFQDLVRNPLVAPDIIGVNAGAGLAAVLVIAGGAPLVSVPVAALGGALVSAFAVYGIAWRRGVSGARLVLVGIGLNALLAGLTTLVILSTPVEQVTPAVVWLAGTLALSDWQQVMVTAGGGGVLLLYTLLLWPRLRVLELGDDGARALGVHAERDRALLLACGAGLSGLAVAVAGPLAFVALVVPHLTRLLVGPLSGGGVVLAALIGALLVLGSDLAGQHLLAPASLPVGLVTASLGAPFFLFLLYRMNRHG